MTARDLLRIAREGWVIIVVTAIVFGIAGWAYSATRKPLYQSTSTLSVSACIAVENAEACDPVSGISYAVQRARIYSNIGTSAPVLRKAVELSDQVETRKELASQVTVAQAADSPIIEVTVTWGTPEGAAEIANSVAVALISYAKESIDNFESDATQVSFEIISEAIAPTEAVASNRQTLVLMAFLGVLVGAVLATLRWYLNTTVRDSLDAQDVTGHEILAELPIAGKPKDTVATESVAAAEFHQLRTVVASKLAAAESRIIAVVTPTDPALSTLVTAGLAHSLTATRTSVAVFRLHDATAGNGGLPLRHLLEDDAPSIPEVTEGPLVFDYVGSPAEAAVALGTPRFARLVSEVAARVDIVLLDCAPGDAGAEMAGAARHADAALVVVGVGETKRPRIGSTLKSLELLSVRILGVASVTKNRR
ncbi:MAG: hypothetical protein IR160_12870 [Salinibacterium sp.]|nr:hypothetical protein [Salinibacterium sp.]MBF0673466.1 hypothetical protein [Salinibacterium sp.]